jgi:hypothetical protein
MYSINARRNPPHGYTPSLWVTPSSSRKHKDTPDVPFSINHLISGYLLRIIEKIRAAVEIKLQQDWLSALMAA